MCTDLALVSQISWDSSSSSSREAAGSKVNDFHQLIQTFTPYVCTHRPALSRDWMLLVLEDWVVGGAFETGFLRGFFTSIFSRFGLFTSTFGESTLPLFFFLPWREESEGCERRGGRDERFRASSWAVGTRSSSSGSRRSIGWMENEVSPSHTQLYFNTQTVRRPT